MGLRRQLVWLPTHLNDRQFFDPKQFRATGVDSSFD
jgi:hypothetical protein